MRAAVARVPVRVVRTALLLHALPGAYQGRRESLGATTEQAITSALQRLSYAGENWIVFLEGHGERSINDSEQGGFGEFAQMLRDKGLKVQALSLVKSPKVPDNASVLVIAAPRSKMLDGEARLIAEYVERGGNLLWLTDPDGNGDVWLR